MGDNTTLNTRAIQTTIETCHTLCRRRPHPESEDSEGTSIVYVPAGFYQTGSIVLSVSNTRLHLGRGGALYGSDDPQHYPLVPLVPPTPPQPPTPPTPPTQQQPGAAGTILHQPPMMMYRPLLYGYHVHNIAITGENRGYPPGAFAHFSSQTATDDDDDDDDASKSIIDGVGWKWWCKSRYEEKEYTTFLYPVMICRFVSLCMLLDRLYCSSHISFHFHFQYTYT